VDDAENLMWFAFTLESIGKPLEGSLLSKGL
jgi:hypothetical protein